MKKNIEAEVQPEDQEASVLGDPDTPIHEEALQDLPDPAPVVQIEEIWMFEELTYQQVGGKGGGLGAIIP